MEIIYHSIRETLPEINNIGWLSFPILSSLFHLIFNVKDFIGVRNGSNKSTISEIEVNVFSRIIASIKFGLLWADDIQTAPPKLLPNNIILLLISLLL